MEDWRRDWAITATTRAIVAQFGDLGCGLACGEMLLADRAVFVSQREIGVGMRVPIDGADLADRLTAVSGMHWLGGAIAGPVPPTTKLVQALVARHGTWAALLEPDGFREVGHWVVVDAVMEDSGTAQIAVRDPIGYAFTVPAAEFLRLWHFTSLVIEVPL